MIETERSDGILTLRIAHGKANAMDVELLQALRAALADARDARAVVITGTGSIFCAGVDLHRLVKGGVEYARDFVPVLCSFVRELFEFSGPVVVAANGHAIAGGAVITMAADYRLMAAGKGRFGIPELLVGVPFPAVAIEVVRFGVPPQHLQSLVYTGKTLLPEHALAAGLIDEVVESEHLDARAHEIAEQFARVAPETFRATKLALRSPVYERIAQQSAKSDAETLAVWTAPITHQRVAEYLQSIARK